MEVDVKVEAEFLASIVQSAGIVERDVLVRTQPEYFQVPSYQWLVKNLRERDWQPPVFDYVDQELLSVAEGEKREKFRNQIYALYQRELSFVGDATRKFRAYISYCIANTSIRSAIEGLQRTDRVDYMLDAIGAGIQDARAVIVGDSLPTFDFATDYDSRMDTRRQLRDGGLQTPRVLTGISGLDRQFVLRAPMVVDFLAPFKRYKSIFLNAMGYSAFLQGFNVVHVTYENSKKLTMDRYDAMFSELNYNRLSNLLITQEEKDALDATFQWMKGWQNRLKVIEAKAEETTVSEIEDALELLKEREGFVPEVEVWDYLNIIGPSRQFQEERRVQKQIVWDLQKHAAEYDVLIYEASQTNMEGAQAERISAKHRGMSIGISQGLDLSVAIDQSEQEKAEGIIVLSPQFARGADVTIPEIVLDADLPRMVISRELHKLWEHAIEVNSVRSG